VSVRLFPVCLLNKLTFDLEFLHVLGKARIPLRSHCCLLNCDDSVATNIYFYIYLSQYYSEIYVYLTRVVRSYTLSNRREIKCCCLFFCDYVIANLANTGSITLLNKQLIDR